jgi:hypothetical protein
MHRQVLARCPFLLVAALVGLARGQTSHDAIQAEVQSPELVSNQTQTGPLASFTLSFDARLTNRSEDPVEIPEPNRVPDGTAWVALRWVQSQESDGAWKFVVGPGLLMWPSDAKFAPCKSLGPQETAEVKRVSQPLTTYKDVLAKLGPPPTVVRAGLGLVCKRQDGTLRSKTVTTEPFVLTLQAR